MNDELRELALGTSGGGTPDRPVRMSVTADGLDNLS